MPFQQLEQYKAADPELATILAKLETYLQTLLSRPPQDPISFYSPAHDINPLWVASELKTTLPRAHALLYLCHKSGLLRPRYDVYCPDTKDFIESFPSVDVIREPIDCPHHDHPTVHEKNSALVSLFFEFAPSVVQQELRMAV